MRDLSVFLLPHLKRCNTLTIQSHEVLVTTGGFEDRSLAAAQIVKPGPQSRVVVLDYRPVDGRNRIEEVIRHLDRAGFKQPNRHVIEYDRYDPEEFPIHLEKKIKVFSPRRVVLDISAMSKLAILLALDVCREMNLNVTIFYAEAETYGPSQEDYEKAKREKTLHQPTIQMYPGVHGVIHVARLSSVAMQGHPTSAFAFMSLNESLTQALVNAVNPSRLFLINGRPPQLSWREEATAWIHEQLRQEWLGTDNPTEQRGDKTLPKRAASTLDYRETVRLLLNLYWSLAVDHRILLAPTGSKMQAVGCFIVKSMHPDIHIEYPTPKGFLDLYSSGVGKRWQLQLGSLGGVVEKLRREERQTRLTVLENN
jgi:hypothetical protein